MGYGSAQITHTTADKFIPELWMDEVRAYLRANLVLADKVKLFNVLGKKGDVVHVPDITEMVTTAKTGNTAVTFQTFTEGEFTLNLNFHQESSFMVEDIAAIQSAYDLRTEYTKNAGYAIAKKIDNGIGALGIALTGLFIGSDGSTAYNGVAGNATDLTEAGIRRVIERLDTANVPQEDRCLWIHPSQKNVLLAIARFTEYQMVGPGGMPIRTGQFGELFGVPVYVSTNVSTSGTGQVCLLFQRNAFVLAIQNQVRVQAEYKVDFLGTGVVCDVVYGYATFRDNHANALVVAP